MDKNKPMQKITARAVHVPVDHSLSPHGCEGVAFAALNGCVVISITTGDDGMCIQLKGEMIDHVAGLFADTVSEATRQSQPTMGGMQ